jgi:hypothetical protein
LWEVATGKAIHELAGRAEGVFNLAFAPDGRTLVAGSDDGTIIRWESLSSEEISRHGKHVGSVVGLAYSPSGRVLASAGTEGTLAVWELHPAVGGRRPRGAALTAAELEGAWRDLGRADAARAFAAIDLLASAPARQVESFLSERLRPKPRVAAATLERLIRDLDAKTFTAREKAARELEAQGDAADVALRRALTNPRSLEARRRLQVLVEKLDERGPPDEQLRAVRALCVLEDLDTPATRKHLQELVEGVSDDLVRREAAAALARLAKRPAPSP